MNRARMSREFLTKATHFALREIGQPPESRPARVLRRWSIGRAGSKPSPETSDQKILIWTIRDWSVHVQLEAVLGQALRALGADVTFATCGGGLEICDRVNTWEGPPMPCRSCTKYVSTSLGAHGFDPLKLSAMWDEGSWPEIDLLSLDELAGVEWNGLPLGRLVDIPVKWFLMGESIDNDPLGASVYRAFLRSARCIAQATEQILERANPDQVILLNGLFLFESIVAELCKRQGISFITYERALMLDTFVFARDSVCALYRIDEQWDRAKDSPLSLEEINELRLHFTNRRTGGDQADNYWHDIRSAQNFSTRQGAKAVLFTNLVWDSAVIGQDIAFKSIVDWLVHVIKFFQARPSDQLVVRVHPAEVKLAGRESRERMEQALRSRISELPENVYLISAEDSTSSYELMEMADFGLVYSSTTGLEMALLGKPVIVSAHTHYRAKGFTLDASSPHELDRLIEQQCDPASRFSPDVALAERYAHLLFFKSSFRDLGVTEPIRGLCRVEADPVVDSIDAEQGDLHRITEAILQRDGFAWAPVPSHQRNT